MRDRFNNRTVPTATTATKVELVKGSGGVFEITVNDKLVFSKKALGRFPDDSEIEAMLTD